MSETQEELPPPENVTEEPPKDTGTTENQEKESQHDPPAQEEARESEAVQEAVEEKPKEEERIALEGQQVPKEASIVKEETHETTKQTQKVTEVQKPNDPEVKQEEGAQIGNPVEPTASDQKNSEEIEVAEESASVKEAVATEQKSGVEVALIQQSPSQEKRVIDQTEQPPQSPPPVSVEPKPEETKVTTLETAEKAEKSSSKPKDQEPRKRRKRLFKDKEKDQQKSPEAQLATPVPQKKEPKVTEVKQVVEQAPKVPQPQSVPVRASQSVHAILQEYTTTHQEDTRVLSDTSFSKKKQNYFQLREWSKIRTEQTALHLNVVDQLQSQLEKAIKVSIENFEMYASFFRERANQQEKYYNHPIINTHFATQSNELSKDVYINCSRLLNSLAEDNMERCKKSQTLTVFIRKNILQDIVEDHTKRTHLELLKIRDKVEKARQALFAVTAQIDQRITKLAVHYNQYVTKLGFDPTRDFLTGQLAFLKKAFEQTQVQKRLGLLVFDYLKIASDEETKRAELIKRCLRLYIDGMIACYGIKPDIDSLRQLDKDEEAKLIPQFYSVEDLLDDRFLEILKRTLNIEGQDLSLGVLYGYLNSFSFLHFNSRILILKDYPITVGEQKDRQLNGRLIVTVDNHLHIFLSTEEAETYPDPTFSFQIDSSLEIKNVRDLAISIHKKDQKRGVLGYLTWSSKTTPSLIVRFLKRDALQEFEEFVTKLV